MKNNEIPEAVVRAAAHLVSAYGDGVFLVGKTAEGYEVYSYDPAGSPDIGAVRFLYKEKESVRELTGSEALSLNFI